MWRSLMWHKFVYEANLSRPHSRVQTKLQRFHAPGVSSSPLPGSLHKDRVLVQSVKDAELLTRFFSSSGKEGLASEELQGLHDRFYDHPLGPYLVRKGLHSAYIRCA